MGRSVAEHLVELAFDPQTSGGLLIAFPKQDAPGLVSTLEARGVSDAKIVGHATTSAQPISVRLV